MARLIDVAREAGVSLSAASVVLGGHSRTIGASKETRQRIREAAQRLGYSPSPAAVSLSTGKTKTLGLLFSNPSDFLTHPNGALALVSMCTSAAEQGYRVLLAAFTAGTAIDERLMDACIVGGSVSDECARQIEKLAKRIPVVSTYRRIPGAIVAVDDGRKPEFAMAAEYLYDLGHRHIAIADIKLRIHPVAEAFQAVAQRRKLDVHLQAFKDEWRDRTYATVEEICRLDPLPTAVFAFDDDYARALVARLARDRRRVPEDVSVFSGETHAAGFQSAPPLTGTNIFQEQQSSEIVRKLVELLRRDEKGASEIEVRSLPPELIVRQSCAAPRP